eukprot:Ihof_evm6s290 gene=Ihof_evmTU6s290
MLFRVAALFAAVAFAAADLSLSVDRTIDLTTQLVKTKSNITITNNGEEAVTHVKVAFEKLTVGDYAAIRVIHQKNGRILTPVENDAGVPEGAHVFSIKLATTLQPKETTSILVRSTVIHGQVAYPSEISQGERQYMVYTGSNYFFSPYTVAKQTTLIQVPLNFESHETNSGAGVVSRNQLRLASSAAISPYTTGFVKVHFASDVPHITIYEMTREITVSHWSRIMVNDIVKVIADGASLKGHFSRLDYTTNPNPPGVIKSWITKLPGKARDVDYRDQVGNVTTSAMFKTKNTLNVHLVPRFPMFGGWKYDYMLNYTLPLSNYLSHSGNSYSVAMPLVSNVMPNLVIDQFTLKVTVPEGASNIVFKYKYPMDSESREFKTTYLDTVGRPTVVVTKSNIVHDIITDFEITYDFDPMAIVYEPAMLIGFYFTMFLAIIIWVRLDFSIS